MKVIRRFALIIGLLSILLPLNKITYDAVPQPCLIHSVNSNSKTLHVRLTVYWKTGKGTDTWTKKGISSTGKPLIQGQSVAVDPKVIPYGTKLKIEGYGTVNAVDTGSDVKKKTASKGKLNVIDLYFDNKQNALQWANNHPIEQDVQILD